MIAMTQEELDELAAQTLHMDVQTLRESNLVPEECFCGQPNCRGWKLVLKAQSFIGDNDINPEEIVRVDCPNCSGDAYKVLTRGRASTLPIEFALCTDCAYLGVYQSDVMIPISEDLDVMLTLHYRRVYNDIKQLSAFAKRQLLAANARWN